MNIAVIIAGSSGARMHQEIPKQFLNVFDRPVILYTFKAGITKQDNVFFCEQNGLDSIRNGMFDLVNLHI